MNRQYRLSAVAWMLAALVSFGVGAGWTSRASAEPPGAELVLGMYDLETPLKRAVIDGDTVRVKGLDATLRLVGIDTEETFKHEDEKTAFAAGWKQYMTARVASSPTPIKFATPLGEAAREWAEIFFRDVTSVRLEIDELNRRRGYYNRYLAYILVERNGKWVNYNIEAVRAGMSPYFTKYGYSRRFHKEFTEAQAEAQKKKLGIWKKGAECYPDYDKRLKWWHDRAETIERFNKKYGDAPDVYELGIDADWDALTKAEGKEVTVFGTVGDIKFGESPSRVYMSHKKGMDFTIVSFKAGLLERLELEKHAGEYVYVRGRVTTYKGRPQFKLDDGPVKVWVE